MGHFSYTCLLSGIPITGGDKAVLLPIFPKVHWGYDCSQKSMTKFGKSTLCSNDGPNLYFDELFFPIFGEYDSYGRLENIEKDDNTKILEEFFGLTIEQISTVLTDGRKDEFEAGGTYCESVKILDKNNKNHMKLLKTSTTWFHRSVYDKLAVSEPADDYDRLDLGEHGILVKLGFEYVGIDKSVERFNKLYRKDTFEIHSDGTWVNIPGQGIYSVFDLKKYCAKFNVEIDPKLIDGGRYSQLYDFILPHTSDIIKFSNNRQLIHMLLGEEHEVKMTKFEMMEELIDQGLITVDVDRQEMLKNSKSKLINENITLFYFTKIKEYGGEFLKKNIIDWFNVKQFFYPTGRFLYPIGTSAQDGNFESVKILLETSLSVINEELKNHYCEDDEDDDED